MWIREPGSHGTEGRDGSIDGAGGGEGTWNDVDMVSLHKRVENKLNEYRIIERIVPNFCFNPRSVDIVQFDPFPSPVGAQNGFLYILFVDDGMPQ
ncbi:hypothetical protein Mpal_1839 [Methanosphaerula palustris E1-9c]|uniref:Uncharacterized protein n=1 Tax=Methanosphaerula palustris (strain ATCC BAA-1556 / DSM 19958 / E1-9c) TaxID=521011 RepID=B8GK74_METPE|nr:hypothetical protein Mpal_1839 [Methanosphaerula palustris E1-9c]